MCVWPKVLTIEKYKSLVYTRKYISRLTFIHSSNKLLTINICVTKFILDLELCILFAHSVLLIPLKIKKPVCQ